jgi:hypothetical protein
VVRMRIPSKLVIVLFVLLPSLAGGWPTDDAKVVVFVTTVRQESPLQITGFKLPDKVGGAPVLVLRNESNKPIRDFHVAADIGNAEANSRGEIGPAFATNTSNIVFWPRERTIPPNSEREAHEGSLRSHTLAGWGGRLHSNCLHVAAIVLSLEFEDGTSWQLENMQDQQVWKSSLHSDSTKSCDHSPVMESALKEWDGPAGNEETGSPSHLDTRTVQSYSVTCPLRNLEGKLVAICPW